MKKIDKLILSSFLGPFILTALVVVFILLIVHMLKYFDDFVGKGLEWSVYAKLMYYFSVRTVPDAMPLGVLLSSLITYGNLGEQFELTAIKSSGISLLRTLRPTFIFVFFLSIGVFFFSNYIVPRTNLQAYSLLWDIKQTKPSLDIREGQFYNGLPNYSIKVTKKMPDGITMKNVIIYDHNKTDGNQRVIVADSCRMYTFMEDRYLMMELYQGTYNSEEKTKKNKPSRIRLTPINQFFRQEFSEMKMVFSLASFDMNKTDLELFSSNKAMKTMSELNHDIDSMLNSINLTRYNIFQRSKEIFDYHMLTDLEIPKELSRAKFDKDTTVFVGTPIKSPSFKRQDHLINLKKLKFEVLENGDLSDSTLASIDTYFSSVNSKRKVIDYAINKARFAKNTASGENAKIDGVLRTMYRFVIEKFRKFTYAFTCITMFLIGAPLGAIIKRGGLGFPVLISIGFFITNYVLTIIAEKWAKQGFVEGEYAVWFSNLILLPIGIYFLRQAKNDARLFDADFYRVIWDKVKTWFAAKKKTERVLVSQ